MEEKKNGTEPKAAAQPAAQEANPAPGQKLALTADFGTVYVKINRGQIMRPIKATITLFEKLGHFYSMPGKWDPATGKSDKKYPITSVGYTQLNKVASISIMTPPTVIVDGVEQPNPYVERNKRTRAIESVIVRKIGLGFSPAGNVVAIDKTLFYNPYTYFIQSIQAKLKKTSWEKNPQTGKREDTGNAANPNAAMVGIAEDKPTKKGSWVFFPIEDPLGIWANYEDPAILDCLEEHTQRQRFGDRIAQKIVERNILKDHPAIGVGLVFAKNGATEAQGSVAYVEVYGYRTDMGYPDLDHVMRQAAKGSDQLVVKAEIIHEADPAEERAEIEEAGEPERSDADEDLGPTGEPADKTDKAEAPKTDPAAGLFKGNPDGAGESSREKLRASRGK
jgi:hypothetical protein